MAHAHTNFATLEHGDYLLENNAWRDPDQAEPPQCIFAPPGVLMGWNWHWPGDDNSRVVAFPEIIYGKKPFRSENASTVLPRKLADLQQISARYAIHTPAIGAFNTVFELWMTRDAEAQQDSIVSEVMIWVANHGLNPAGRHVHTFASSSGPAQLFEMDQRYLAFVLEREALSGEIDLLSFLHELQRLKLISADNYVTSVEFGNEIAYGQGVSIVEDYAVRVR